MSRAVEVLSRFLGRTGWTLKVKLVSRSRQKKLKAILVQFITSRKGHLALVLLRLKDDKTCSKKTKLLRTTFF